MNRHQRREDKSLAGRRQKDGLDRVVAIHEAGHAVARVLTIGELGYSVDKAIHSIDLKDAAAGMSIDRKTQLRSQAVTYGLLFSREIENYAAAFKAARLENRGAPKTGKDTLEVLTQIVRAARADIGRWFRARTFISVSGSMAEAIYRGKTFNGIWAAYEAEEDVKSTIKDGLIAGMTTDEIETEIVRTAALSAYLMEKPNVWRAVNGLAEILPIQGRMEGSEATKAITSELGTTDSPAMFSEAIRELAEIGDAIKSANAVIARYADDSEEIIKGADYIESMVRSSQKTIKAVGYDCNFRTLQETLYYAFGDGSSDRRQA
jgi:hypothetical protein